MYRYAHSVRTLAIIAACTLPGLVLAGAAQHGRLFSQRHFTATIEAGDGVVERVGVRLPLNAKIPKVEVYADVRDMGDSTRAWKKCNLDSKRCAVGDVRIERFHRRDHRAAEEPWQELSVDVINENGSDARAVKLVVTYQPQGGKDLKSCRLDTDCGWHERLSAAP